MFTDEEFEKNDIILEEIFKIEDVEIRNSIQLMLESRKLDNKVKLEVLESIILRSCPWVLLHIEYLWEYFELSKYYKKEYIFTKYRLPKCIVCDSHQIEKEIQSFKNYIISISK